jgi:hypothetical protein
MEAKMSDLIERFKTRIGYPTSAERKVQEDKEMRQQLTEQQIDKTLKDSFPCSDPPAWY